MCSSQYRIVRTEYSCTAYCTVVRINRTVRTTGNRYVRYYTCTLVPVSRTAVHIYHRLMHRIIDGARSVRHSAVTPRTTTSTPLAPRGGARSWASGKCPGRHFAELLSVTRTVEGRARGAPCLSGWRASCCSTSLPSPILHHHTFFSSCTVRVRRDLHDTCNATWASPAASGWTLMKFASPEVAAAATSPQTGGAMPPSSTPCGSSPYCTPDPVQTRTNDVCVLNYNLGRFTTL